MYAVDFTEVPFASYVRAVSQSLFGLIEEFVLSFR